MIAARLPVDGKGPFSVVAQEINAAMAAAYNYADTPLSSLVDESNAGDSIVSTLITLRESEQDVDVR